MTSMLARIDLRNQARMMIVQNWSDRMHQGGVTTYSESISMVGRAFWGMVVSCFLLFVEELIRLYFKVRRLV